MQFSYQIITSFFVSLWIHGCNVELNVRRKIVTKSNTTQNKYRGINALKAETDSLNCACIEIDKEWACLYQCVCANFVNAFQILYWIHCYQHHHHLNVSLNRITAETFKLENVVSIRWNCAQRNKNADKQWEWRNEKQIKIMWKSFDSFWILIDEFVKDAMLHGFYSYN